MSEFVIDVSSLRSPSERVEVAADAEDIGLQPEQWVGKVRGVFQVETLGEKLSVRGRLEAVAELECVRCLRGFEAPLRVPFDVFAERSGQGRRSEEQELEREHDLVFFNGRQLDLAEAARDALIVEIPMAPHCRDDCRGLCSTCGADLNEAPCLCPGKT
jgi:uncharacterized protein